MIQAVIFDVDGTLLNTERIYMRTWKEAGAKAGFDVTQDVLLRTRAVNSQEAKKIFQDALGPDFNYEAIQAARVDLNEALIAQCENLVMPGVKETLDTLKAKGYPMAVASSTGYEKTAAHLEHAGLLHYFDAVVGGDMVQRGKPNPDIFLKAAQLLGIEAENCLVVGDTPADIKAATAAGMPRILIPDCVQPDETIRAMSNHILDSMHQLVGILEGVSRQ